MLQNSHFVTGSDQLGEIILDGVVRDSGHGDAVARSHVPAGEDNVADRGDDLGIVVKGLVEIAEAEHNDGVGQLFFDAEVLLAERGHRGE